MVHFNKKLELLAFAFMVVCSVSSADNNACELGRRDHEILSKRNESSTIRFPWSVDIYQFHHFRGHGVIISSKHILTPASHILPYKGWEVETKDNGDGLPNHYWVEHTQIAVSASKKRNIDHAYVHPDYNPLTYDNNIAIMEVDRIIPVDDHWTRPVFLPEATPLTLANGKLNVAFPVGTTLKPYMAAKISDDECAQINGNANASANTLMCIDGLCAEHECDRYGGFSQPLFSIIPDGSIEIIGLPLWSKKEVKTESGMHTVSVYNRIVDALPWIEGILSKRCKHDPPIPIACTQKMLFAKSCEKVIVASSSGGILNRIVGFFYNQKKSL